MQNAEDRVDMRKKEAYQYKSQLELIAVQKLEYPEKAKLVFVVQKQVIYTFTLL